MVTSCWYGRSSCLLAWLSLISMVMPPSSASLVLHSPSRRVAALGDEQLLAQTSRYDAHLGSVITAAGCTE
jgi:hypothetical protein